jgi:hypothetical protein
MTMLAISIIYEHESSNNKQDVKDANSIRSFFPNIIISSIIIINESSGTYYLDQGEKNQS